jgi:putative aminopeptidase FrvX
VSWNSNRAGGRPRRGRCGRALGLAAALLAALAPHRAAAQASGVDALAYRFAGMTAVTGLEQAMTDSLVALLPGSTRDRAGNVVLALGEGTPKRLLTCPLDEVGYVVGHITPEGYLLLRRVSGRLPAPLFDQQLEGHRVTVFGTRGAVPGVVAVRSVHLTRGRLGPGAPDPVFTVDNAYVDLGAASAADVRALGIDVLAPVALVKQPQRYGERLLAAPAAGRRAACAAVVAALLAKPKAKGAVVVAFTVQSQYAQNAGTASVQALLGPFAETKTVHLATRHPDTPVETVALRDAEALVQEVVTWVERR